MCDCKWTLSAYTSLYGLTTFDRLRTHNCTSKQVVKLGMRICVQTCLNILLE